MLSYLTIDVIMIIRLFLHAIHDVSFHNVLSNKYIKRSRGAP